MTLYAIHNADGVIVQTIEQIDELLSEGELLASPISDIWRRKNPHDLYYDAVLGEAVASAAIAASLDKAAILGDGVDAATLSGLPDPCYLLVNNELVKVTGGSYPISKAGPGEVIFRAVGQYKTDVLIVTAYDLAALKVEVADRIDAAAEATRLKYITAGSGQAMVYQAKSDEAKLYAAATSPVDSDYPLLNAEATATGVTVASLASSVLSLSAQWIGLAALIEGLRMGGKKAASDAVTIDAVLAAEQVNWP
jgi:hypothetical protein